jgi:hypothetical protein
VKRFSPALPDDPYLFDFPVSPVSQVIRPDGN